MVVRHFCCGHWAISAASNVKLGVENARARWWVGVRVASPLPFVPLARALTIHSRQSINGEGARDVGGKVAQHAFFPPPPSPLSLE